MGTPKMNSSSARIGYARVSTADQNLDAQMAALQAAGCTMVHTETGDGATLAGRPELRTILDFIHPGETLVVTRIDRLARSMRDLQIIVATLKDKGAHLAATEQPVDTSTAAGKAFFDMLGVFAEFETNLRRERQVEGIAAAKQRGAYRGRPRQDRHGSHQASAGQGPVADGHRPRTGDISRNRLQGQGGHRVTRSAKCVFAPGNVVIHLEAGHRRIVRVMFFKMSIYARSGRLGLSLKDVVPPICRKGIGKHFAVSQIVNSTSPALTGPPARKSGLIGPVFGRKRGWLVLQSALLRDSRGRAGQAGRCTLAPPAQRSPRLNVTASNGRMLTGSSSFALAISNHCPSWSSNASRVRSIGSTSHR